MTSRKMTMGFLSALIVLAPITATVALFPQRTPVFAAVPATPPSTPPTPPLPTPTPTPTPTLNRCSVRIICPDGSHQVFVNGSCTCKPAVPVE